MAQVNKTAELAIETAHFQLRLLPAQPYQVRFTSQFASLGYVFDSQQGRHALGSDRATDFYASANSFAYLPSGCDVYSESLQGGEYLKIWGQSKSGLLPLHSDPVEHVASPEIVRLANQLRQFMLRLNVAETVNANELDQRVLEWLAAMPLTGDEYRFQRLPKNTMQALEASIERHLGDAVDVFFLANQLGFSAAYFSRVFKQSFGRSPYDFILDRRLTAARQLLTQSRQGITEIALELGFNSHAHFSTAFKHRLGMTPRKFRQSVRQAV